RASRFVFAPPRFHVSASGQSGGSVHQLRLEALGRIANAELAGPVVPPAVDLHAAAATGVVIPWRDLVPVARAAHACGARTRGRIPEPELADPVFTPAVELSAAATAGLIVVDRDLAPVRRRAHPLGARTPA